MTKDERIAELEEENRQLRDILAPAVSYIGVSSKGQTRILSALHAARGKPVSTERLFVALDSGDAVVKTLMCRLRKTVGPKGVEISHANPGGEGYRIVAGLDVLDSMRRHG